MEKGTVTKYDTAYYSTQDGLHFSIGAFELWQSYYGKPHFVTAELKDGSYVEHTHFSNLETALCDLRKRSVVK